MIRIGIAISAVVVGVLFCWFLDAALPGDLAIVFLDKGGEMPPYPYSIQNVMWVVFFVGVGEIINRYRETRADDRQLSMGYLPQDDRTLLVKANLPPIYRKIALAKDGDRVYLPGLLRRIISSFQTTNSVESASAILNSSIELRSHEIELRYSMLRYIQWVIPSLGFLGTVVGIALALNYAGIPENAQDPNLLPNLTRKLAVAFNTTLVALIQASLIVLAVHIVQGFEERVLNRSGQYCLDNLINRLYKGEEGGG